MTSYHDVTISIFMTSYLCSLLVRVVIDFSDHGNVDLTKYILHGNNFNVQTRFYPHVFFVFVFLKLVRTLAYVFPQVVRCAMLDYCFNPERPIPT